MQIFGIQSPFSDVTSHSTKLSKNGASFNELLDSAGNDGMQQFKAYMKETPAQRMFASFLASQHISQSQYDAMSPQQQKALQQQFAQQLEKQMEEASKKDSSLNVTQV